MSGVAWMIRQGQVETGARYALAFPAVVRCKRRMLCNASAASISPLLLSTIQLQRRFMVNDEHLFPPQAASFQGLH